MEEEDDIGIIDATNIATEEDETSSTDDSISRNDHVPPEFLAGHGNSDSSSDYIGYELESEDDNLGNESNDSESKSNVESESKDFESDTHSGDASSSIVDHSASNKNSEGELLHPKTLNKTMVPERLMNHLMTQTILHLAGG
jgi:hypothetical protein